MAFETIWSARVDVIQDACRASERAEAVNHFRQRSRQRIRKPLPRNVLPSTETAPRLPRGRRLDLRARRAQIQSVQPAAYRTIERVGVDRGQDPPHRGLVRRTHPTGQRIRAYAE
jgi:hypothetical protein